MIVFSKKVVTMWEKMLKIHQKRRDSLISVYLNRGKDANFNNGYCYVVA